MAQVPSMRTTLSVVSPDKAAQIRSAVTGALKKDASGLPFFENTVETTFLLPWDLNPKVQELRYSPTHFRWTVLCGHHLFQVMIDLVHKSALP